MRAGLSWADSALVTVAEASQILKIANGKPTGAAAKTKTFVSLRKRKLKTQKPAP